MRQTITEGTRVLWKGSVQISRPLAYGVRISSKASAATVYCWLCQKQIVAVVVKRRFVAGDTGITYSDLHFWNRVKHISIPAYWSHTNHKLPHTQHKTRVINCLPTTCQLYSTWTLTHQINELHAHHQHTYLPPTRYPLIINMLSTYAYNDTTMHRPWCSGISLDPHWRYGGPAQR